MPHSPSVQVAEPFAGISQICPQPPQLSRSASRLVHIVAQGAKPGPQAKLQSLFKHTGAPFIGDVQVAPQPPQLLGSSRRTTHSPPQTVSPSRQVSGGPPSPPVPAVPAPPDTALGRTQTFVDMSHV